MNSLVSSVDASRLALLASLSAWDVHLYGVSVVVGFW